MVGSYFSFLFLLLKTGWPYYVALMAASGHLSWQIGTVDLSSRADCNKKCVSDLKKKEVVLLTREFTISFLAIALSFCAPPRI